MNQIHSNFEHILIDNVSIDNTIYLAKKEYSIKNSTENLLIISEKDKITESVFGY